MGGTGRQGHSKQHYVLGKWMPLLAAQQASLVAHGDFLLAAFYYLAFVSTCLLLAQAKKCQGTIKAAEALASAP